MTKAKKSMLTDKASHRTQAAIEPLHPPVSTPMTLELAGVCSLYVGTRNPNPVSCVHSPRSHFFSLSFVTDSLTSTDQLFRELPLTLGLSSDPWVDISRYTKERLLCDYY